MTVTRSLQLCKFNNEKQKFFTLSTCVFICVRFAASEEIESSPISWVPSFLYLISLLFSSFSFLFFACFIKHNDKNIWKMKNNSLARFAREFFICAHFEFAAVLILYAILDGKANLKVFFKKH